jgi:hypothetical protein
MCVERTVTLTNLQAQAQVQVQAQAQAQAQAFPGSLYSECSDCWQYVTL